ncbi:MAG TPA: glycine--tRNA ligase subunit alpha [Candidatus Coatesbacteria bacterium]|mgnify:CR=1 FL=1|nr:glycine--tRNA ligase subunit alpha [Candidatus Coatesbacteria bacterium]
MNRLTLQELTLRFYRFWADQGCLVGHGYDMPTGAGTANPLTFFGVLGPRPWRTAYVEPSRRPDDGRYGENPHRFYKHYQLQVILKPSPPDIQSVYLDSLRAVGIEPLDHDVKFDEDNWESPSLGAWGTGWQVLLDGMEITQFTYFQQMGGLELKPVSVELTYGLERLLMHIAGTDDGFDLPWSSDVLYRRLQQMSEYENSRYSYEAADVKLYTRQFDELEAEAERLLKGDEPLVHPAYDLVCLATHLFNVLDARGVVGAAERARYLGRLRRLAQACATAYLEAVEKRPDWALASGESAGPSPTAES